MSGADVESTSRAHAAFSWAYRGDLHNAIHHLARMPDEEVRRVVRAAVALANAGTSILDPGEPA